MTRTAILVEHGFLDHHVGVRNYLFSLSAYLEAAGGSTQFVSLFRPYSHAANWYRIHLRDPQFATDNGIRADWRIAAPAAEVLAEYHHDAAHRLAAPGARPDIFWSQIGNRLEVCGFDQLVVSNPWLVDFDERLPVRRVVGVVYDCIPNRFVLSQPQKPFEFAAQHLRGFRYFRDRCDQTLAISEQVADDLRGLLGFPTDRVAAFPPMVPPGCLPPAARPVRRRPGSVLLASPFDPRKGLRAMPRLITGLDDAVQVLLVYGGVRCHPTELERFFDALPPGLPVEWYPRATAATTERLFRQAKLLLFPSLSEGLGLPLIEAQLRGCPAVARPARPMCDLLVGASQTLPGDHAGDVAVSRELLTDERFDHDGLATAAHEFFGTDTLAGRVAALVQGDASSPTRWRGREPAG